MKRNGVIKLSLNIFQPFYNFPVGKTNSYNKLNSDIIEVFPPIFF